MQERILLDELNKTKAELSILYEISNAMHTTLKLDEILYIILTGVTAHIGLGFNRAMLLLINSNIGQLEGKMGIGPDTAEAADHIWKNIDTEKMKLEDLINCFSEDNLERSKFNSLARSISIPYDEKNGGILALSINDGMSLHITNEKLAELKNDAFLRSFHSEELAIVPLKVRDNVTGLIVADNFVTRKPITKDDIRMLTMFANQAGLAIEKSRLYEKTLIRSHTDSLTGLWDHGYFQERLGNMLDQAKDQQDYLSLIMIDIDDFKIYNDTWGHQKGDEVLSKLARLFQEASRKLDYVCRYGGEEFAVVLPRTNLKDAVAIAERINSTVGRHHFEPAHDLPAQRITLSLGVATFPIHARTKSELIQAADKALYEAKRKGKNRISTFSF